jgi:hypothetical protein
VGDFDGDGADEIMVYTPSTGNIKLYKFQSNGLLGEMSGYKLGNMEGRDFKNKLILAGDFGQAASRQDILVVDRAAGQITRFDTATDTDGKTTFWWAFTSAANLFSNNDQLIVSNINGSARDDIVIRNASNGQCKLFQLEYNNGNLTEATGVDVGQLPMQPGRGSIAAAKVREPELRNEQGIARDDILYFDDSIRQIIRTDARFDAARNTFTYWWAYTSYLMVRIPEERTNDFDGDDKADILVTSPWGLGVLTLSGNNIAVHTMSPNGARFGDWELNTQINNTELRADFDGDGKAELLMSSPSGIGILKLVNGRFNSIATAKNGTRYGGWIINTVDNQFLYAADYDGDGKEEVLLTSPWGLGILKYANNEIISLMLAANGTRFGEWLLNTDDNFFTLIGDFDGDGQIEILVTSPSGLGILKFNGITLTSVAMAPNSSRLGDWVLDTSTDRFEVVGDFDGDNRAEILVSNASKIGILKLQGNNLTSICIANTGEKLGRWMLDSKTNKMNVVGDYDGDGKTEVLITSDWGLGVLKLNGNVLQSTVAVPNGTRFGGWLLNTRDNRLNYAADFDADGRAEIQITSPWGMGILQQSGNTFNSLTMSPNGTRFGGWLLNTADNDLEAGLGQSYGVIICHPDWQGAVNNTTEFLRNRGYTIFVTPNAAKGIGMLKHLALYLKASDRLFVYIAAHGNTSRAIGDMTKSISLMHGLEFGDGYVTYDQFSPSFQLMGNKGVDLSVFDGSCEGGEAVLNAIGERYLAMSTTTVYGAGGTNTPDPSEIMRQFGKPSKFGLWWSPSYTVSLLTPKTPHRFWQKIYRNDNTEINLQSLFYKSAIEFYTRLSYDWEMWNRSCYLCRYVYPDTFSSLEQWRRDAMTGSTGDFLASMRANLNAYAPSIASLRSMLNNTTLVNKAADVYTRSFPRPWQTIFGDMGWNVVAEPTRYSSHKNALIPGSYIGNVGFARMVNETLNLLTVLEKCYDRAKGLLRQIDAEVQIRSLYSGVFEVQALPVKNITDYLRFNEYEEQRNIQTVKILNDVNLDRALLNKALSKSAANFEAQKVFRLFENSNLDAIGKQVSTLRGDTATSLSSFECSVYLDKLFYLLTIVEEAISSVQSINVEPGDLVRF